MKLPVLPLLLGLAAAHPGLLRVPKVYNAVITSNQNLSPSRAFPVIQPVIHRTAIGYVPPFYYTQLSPQFAGPEVVHLPYGPRLSPGGVPDAEKPTSGEGSQAETFAESSANAEAGRLEKEEQKDEAQAEKGSNGNGDRKDTKKKYGDQAPLSFYPNYHSLYYDPYFYAYNTFNPHLVPGTYYHGYQPYGAPPPIPPTKDEYSERLLPGYLEEKREKTKSEVKEKIPDVPPPPLPTAVPKSS